MHRIYQDADIPDDAILYRRITPGKHTSPQPDGTHIVTGFAFREKEHEFSLYIAAEVSREKVLSCGFEGQEIIEVTAGDIRMLGYILVREPDQCHHSHVFAHPTHYKSRNEVARDCKKLAEIVNKRRLRSG